MNRRVLIAIALVVLLMVGMLAFLTAPDTGGVGQVAAPEQAPDAVEAAAAQAPRVRLNPDQQLSPKVVGQPDDRLVWDPTNPREDFGVQPLDARQLNPEARREYRCRALGQQSDLVDKLVVVGSGAGVNEAQRVNMVSRVAMLSTRIFDEGESLWSGELSCEGISDVNLGRAADFLAGGADDLELDEKTRAEVEQALAVLDSVDWNPHD